MKVQLLLPVTILASVASVWFMTIRKKDHATNEKQHRFQDIKLRVSNEVLEGYQSEKETTQNLLKKTQSEWKSLEDVVNMLKTKADQVKGEADTCQGDKKPVLDWVVSAESELKQLKADFDKEKTSWETEVETLKRQLSARSAVCDHLKKGSEVAARLCGDDGNVEAPKQEEAKAEAPKQEEAKAEAPKQEEAKAEAPKQEAAKAEAPKQEEAKAEAPKQEEAKVEAPKQEAAKAEAPKQEEAPKAEPPKKR